jgi:hypothetical protein
VLSSIRTSAIRNVLRPEMTSTTPDPYPKTCQLFAASARAVVARAAGKKETDVFWDAMQRSANQPERVLENQIAIAWRNATDDQRRDFVLMHFNDLLCDARRFCRSKESKGA